MKIKIAFFGNNQWALGWDNGIGIGMGLGIGIGISIEIIGGMEGNGHWE